MYGAVLQYVVCITRDGGENAECIYNCLIMLKIALERHIANSIVTQWERNECLENRFFQLTHFCHL